MSLAWFVFALTFGLCLAAPLSLSPDDAQTAEILNKLGADRQKAFVNYLSSVHSEKDLILLTAKLHKTEPDLYEVIKVIVEKGKQLLETSNKEASNFMDYYAERALEMKDDSTGEYDKFVEDVNAKLKTLSKEGRNEVMKTERKDGILKDD